MDVLFDVAQGFGVARANKNIAPMPALQQDADTLAKYLRHLKDSK